ncbi:Asp-tRNA(Asn)/Glu-tRNA(Gln) amidotransferase GatCAB subunit C [Candidatus Campbellbacteria bacterium CG22_combo_CG10-13_8_21_14_all_36_13]|uniref:Asp-tRNA(Asn)/Glu-tRNA(Gln) amidotransferase GatCAB subunit C n=1 Tax=Candidatus Campbellbacteria bacterium CG22_combo_CG10-13_8_21_14_all_36_13 TaxID=1974529 RepID=A0A2H0DYQ3_9BACT|nr:MAG: Asp-tRNA(Asn)/Glu-tRNA(Gln) amidotransferase GatCAB subunit C [Candidatus Campbellbacteria bacterium CG22_combo_CG10-13_8_21_14_all_36_13]
MIDKEKIHELANLARINMTEEEEKELTGEVEHILEFVESIQEASSVESDNFKNTQSYNVMRKDDNEHNKSLYTKDLIREAPDKDGNYVRVKKIL